MIELCVSLFLFTLLIGMRINGWPYNSQKSAGYTPDKTTIFVKKEWQLLKMSTYEISKSSLLSLKAEILRKQQELVKAKANNEVKIKLIKKNTPLEIKNKGIEERQKNDVDEEEEDLLKQSRSQLEAKSLLYNKLSSGKFSEEDKEKNRRYLVRFEKKYKSKVSNLPPSSDSEDQDKYPDSDEGVYKSDDEADKDPGEKWVDYVDCLGRTRKCLQKDLEYLKIKDDELKKTVEAKNKPQLIDQEYNSHDKCTNKNEEDTNKDKDEDINSNQMTQESEMLSSDMRRELLRQQWEREEEELRDKTNIHYQDILFDEARTHGVGYYGFSKNEEERAKQQEALKKIRDETQQEQKKAQELKALREKQLAARIKAAKTRKRARLGLPPEDEEPEPIEKPDEPKEEQKIQVELKQKEQEKEKVLDEARRRHVRPWDIGKEGVKEHYEMSQEEWVEKQRSERPAEFAPPKAYRKEFRSTVNNYQTDDIDKSLNFTTKKLNKRPYNSNSEGNASHNRHSLNPYKSTDSALNSHGPTNFEEIPQNTSIHATPIVNLCVDSDFDDRLLGDYEKVINNIKQRELNDSYSSDSSDSDHDRTKQRGAEIAPPPTFDYYGPSHSKRPKSTPEKNNIHDSIEAGLKFLRNQVEEKEKSTKHPREMYLS